MEVKKHILFFDSESVCLKVMNLSMRINGGQRVYPLFEITFIALG